MSEAIRVPEVGESVTEGVLVEWHQEDGAMVAVDDPLFELETDKITLTVSAEAAGRLSIEVQAEAEVEVGQVVGHIDTEASAAEGEPTRDGQDEDEDEDEGDGDGEDRGDPEGEDDGGEDEGDGDGEDRGDPEGEDDGGEVDLSGHELSPAVRRLVVEHGLDPARIRGTGKGGRITKEDVLEVIEASDQENDKAPEKKAKAPEKKAKAPEKKAKAPEKKAKAPEKKAKAPGKDAPGQAAPRTPARSEPRAAGERETRRPMSSLRRRLASRLVQVQQQTAMLTTFNEVDMTRVMELRARFKEPFEQRHGVRLGFMSFFVKAAVDALKAVPAVNNRIDGDEIVEQHVFDVGVAVSTEHGLVVPVLRDVEKLSYADIEAAIRDFAERARRRKLTLDELQGGTFTISNGGVYGSLLSTPILNPPQSAILGMHGIKKRPVVVGEDDRIEARPMMYLALSYDHRIVDGAEAVTFLRRIVETLEAPERGLFDL